MSIKSYKGDRVGPSVRPKEEEEEKRKKRRGKEEDKKRQGKAKGKGRQGKAKAKEKKDKGKEKSLNCSNYHNSCSVLCRAEVIREMTVKGDFNTETHGKASF